MDFYVVIVALALLFGAFWYFGIFQRRYLEPVFMGVILFGVVALCQPFSMWLYSHGFSIVFPGTLGYIFAIHLK